MQDLSRFEEMVFRHRHEDGTWGEFAAADHDAAAHDDGRKWSDTERFVCDCGEEVEVSRPTPGPEPS